MMEQEFVKLSMFNIEMFLRKDESLSASRARATVKHLRAEEVLYPKQGGLGSVGRVTSYLHSYYFYYLIRGVI